MDQMIVVNEELKAYIDPLTEDEYQALERSILAEGCRDALVLWGDVLVDGHNRYGICRKHDLPFQTVQNTRFQSLEDVKLWMIDQHLGRRSISDFQRGVLALRKREIVAERSARRTVDLAQQDQAAPVASPSEAAGTAKTEALETREALAKMARLSSKQVLLIEKIHKQAAPEVVAAVKAGEISINAAAAVATLPTEEQIAAAAVGKDELKLAAKRVRESRQRNNKPAKEAAPQDEPAAAPAPTTPDAELFVQTLQQRLAALTAENTALREQVAQLQAQLQAHAGQGPAPVRLAHEDAPFE